MYFFGLIEAANDSTNTLENDNSTATDYNEPKGMVKQDWNITDNHMVEFTGIHNRSDYSVKTYTSSGFDPSSHETLSDSYDVEEGGDILIGKYTGYLTDNFTLSLQAGQLKNTNAYRTTAAPGEDCVAAYDSTAGGLAYTGCWNEAAFTVRDAAWGPDEDKRNAYRIDGEWGLGDHLVRFGYDYEKFTSGAAGLIYSGGEYYRYFRVGASGNGSFNGETVNIGANNMYVRYRNLQTTSASYSGDAAEGHGKGKFRMMLEGAKFSDTHGFNAVWTPEGHFHAFGGLYPHPAVAGAALAAITEHVQIHSGSVVLPLHHPIRVAEQWSMVASLSNGRVGLSIASGWWPRDFVIMPENYAEAKANMFRDIEKREISGQMAGNDECRLSIIPLLGLSLTKVKVESRDLCFSQEIVMDNFKGEFHFKNLPPIPMDVFVSGHPISAIKTFFDDKGAVEILCEGSIDKNRKIVMSPRGARNNKGLKAKPDNFNCTALNIKINTVMSKARGKVSKFIRSFVSMR